jgi:hypothetical protein
MHLIGDASNGAIGDEIDFANILRWESDMARQNERNKTSEFSRRDILSTAVIAGGALTAASASIAQTADQAPNPIREPGVSSLKLRTMLSLPELTKLRYSDCPL